MLFLTSYEVLLMAQQQKGPSHFYPNQSLVTQGALQGTFYFKSARGDTRVTPEDKQRLAEQRAAEIAERRADFNATNN